MSSEYHHQIIDFHSVRHTNIINFYGFWCFCRQKLTFCLRNICYTHRIKRSKNERNPRVSDYWDETLMKSSRNRCTIIRQLSISNWFILDNILFFAELSSLCIPIGLLSAEKYRKRRKSFFNKVFKTAIVEWENKFEALIVI